MTNQPMPTPERIFIFAITSLSIYQEVIDRAVRNKAVSVLVHTGGGDINSEVDACWAPGLPFHNFGASNSGDRRVLCSSETSMKL